MIIKPNEKRRITGVKGVKGLYNKGPFPVEVEIRDGVPFAVGVGGKSAIEIIGTDDFVTPSTLPGRPKTSEIILE